MNIVFITGCANGIGRHLATTFYQRGDAVIITDIDEVGIQALTATWDANRAAAPGWTYAIKPTGSR